jgi:Protein of unknown function (DUF3592)
MDLGYAIIIFVAGVGFIALVAVKWRAFAQVLRGTLGKNWPTLLASVDLVDVIEQRDGPRGEISSYLATLTYVYRNPEMQTGEYTRKFYDKDEAQAWVNSYKGSTVSIHVDPQNPTRSVLRKQDL